VIAAAGSSDFHTRPAFPYRKLYLTGE